MTLWIAQASTTVLNVLACSKKWDKKANIYSASDAETLITGEANCDSSHMRPSLFRLSIDKELLYLFHGQS